MGDGCMEANKDSVCYSVVIDFTPASSTIVNPEKPYTPINELDQSLNDQKTNEETALNYDSDNNSHSGPKIRLKRKGSQDNLDFPKKLRRLEKPNWDKYKVDWAKDRQSGFGIEKWADGAIYKGDYHKGKKDGNGVFAWNDGSNYNGEFFKGKMEGIGK